ncbi:MAG: hypothetical protein JJU12_01085 [Chlamydiales bacterium]|nr:hypothetical protein [Chlamydiales bacterium]
MHRGFEKVLSRNHFYLFLFGCLILPTLAVTCYAAEIRGIFFVALLSLTLSLCGAWYLLKVWELKMQRSVSKIVNLRLARTQIPPVIDETFALRAELAEARRGYEHQIDLLQSSVAKSKEEVRRLNLDMDKKIEEMRIAYLEFEDLRKEYHRLEEDYTKSLEEKQKEVKHKESLNNEYQRTISEQRMILEKKQRYITKLEGKVHDLMYEIRSLLQLEEPSDPPPAYLPPSHSSVTPYDLSLQLQRFIEKAEEQMGMDHLGGKSPRFLDPSGSYAVDRRRLFDSLRDETVGIVFVLSISENKFLFVNQHVKALLGWSPEKFMKEFPRLVVSGYQEWKEGLKNIGPARECQTRIEIQGKTGERREFSCVMGVVSRGPFINHIMGILT